MFTLNCMHMNNCVHVFLYVCMDSSVSVCMHVYLIFLCVCPCANRCECMRVHSWISGCMCAGGSHMVFCVSVCVQM